MWSGDSGLYWPSEAGRWPKVEMNKGGRSVLGQNGRGQIGMDKMVPIESSVNQAI